MNLPVTITDMSRLAFIYILVRFNQWGDFTYMMPYTQRFLSLTHWGRDKMAAIFQRTFSNGFSWINISLKFVPRGRINNIPTLVQVMAWRRPGDKPLSEPMMARLPTHICVTRPQWVNNDKGKIIRQVVNPRHNIKWLYFNYLHYFIN